MGVGVVVAEDRNSDLIVGVVVEAVEEESSSVDQLDQVDPFEGAVAVAAAPVVGVEAVVGKHC